MSHRPHRPPSSGSDIAHFRVDLCPLLIQPIQTPHFCGQYCVENVLHRLIEPAEVVVNPPGCATATIQTHPQAQALSRCPSPNQSPTQLLNAHPVLSRSVPKFTHFRVVKSVSFAPGVYPPSAAFSHVHASNNFSSANHPW